MLLTPFSIKFHHFNFEAKSSDLFLVNPKSPTTSFKSFDSINVGALTLAKNEAVRRRPRPVFLEVEMMQLILLNCCKIPATKIEEGGRGTGMFSEE